MALKAWLHIHAPDLTHFLYVPQRVPLSSPPQVPFFMASNPNSWNFDREKDCREIHGSWGQLNQLGQGLAHRSRTELRKVRETYKAMYGEDLVDCIRRAKALDPKNEVRSYLISRANTHKHIINFCSWCKYVTSNFMFIWFRQARSCHSGFVTHMRGMRSWLRMPWRKVMPSTGRSSRSTSAGNQVSFFSFSKLTKQGLRKIWTKRSAD